MSLFNKFYDELMHYIEEEQEEAKERMQEYEEDDEIVLAEYQKGKIDALQELASTFSN